MHKILVIGSGGIGVELLKNLYLSKQKNITLVDFDTISITNLNRQFFYKSINVNDYKAKIASETYKKKVKNSNFTFHTNKIQEFDLSFFKIYDIVYNCLDNDEARRYVNQRCLLGNIPLIDGGSTGFLGQSQYFTRNSCFDCLEQEVKKEYPVCSIRLIPETYEHCVIWAKSIFFEEYVCGKKNEEYYEETLKHEDEHIDDRVNDAKAKKYNNSVNLDSENNKKRKLDCSEELVSYICSKNYIPDNLELIDKIQKDLQELRYKDVNEFDKDNKLIMNLIHSAATLRSISFNISPKQQIETENIAGNIIPAVCTTNSIVASLMKLTGDKLLSKNTAQHYNYFISRSNVIQKIKATNYNSECKTCKSTFYVYKKKPKTTLGEFMNLLKSILTDKYMILSDAGLIYDAYYTTNKETELLVEHNNFLYVVTDNQKRLTIYVMKGKYNKIIKM
ncbi:E1 ubiquitin-activating protein uba2 [Binucleata daphniae]